MSELVTYANEYLRVAEIGDWANALNGLQVENSGTVRKIGAAVDASTRTFDIAAKAGVGFLIVHHGMFWGGLEPVTAAFRRQLALLFEHDIALYGAHLPLDAHSAVGNNAQLATSLGLDETEPFFETKGQLIGVKARGTVGREELVQRLRDALGGPVQLIAAGPAETHCIGVVTGGAGSGVVTAAREGIDTFITGEASHAAAIAAEELGVNLLLGGHYATETFGVKALAAHLAQRFDLPWEFLDAPTGL